MLRFLTFKPNHDGSHVFDEGNPNTKKKNYHCRSAFGQNVEWLEGRHYEERFLEKYRFLGDIEIDRILSLNAENKDISGEYANTIEACKKIYDRRLGGAQEDERLAVEEQAMFDFYRHYHDFIPSWVDFDQIQKGIDVFLTYSPVAAISLYYLSLVPGFALPKIAKVLEQTRYLVPPSSAEQVGNRLMDTGGFVSNAMLPNESGLSAASLRPGCRAWRMALQVRTLHAKVRRSILQNKRINWDTKTYGIPINQEDMAATLLAFSVNVLMGVAFVSGRELSADEQKNYIALWRYIGWLLGIESDEKDTNFQSFENSVCSDLEPLDPCGTRLSGRVEDDSIIHARATLESMIIHLMHPNKSSSTVAKFLLSVGRLKENDLLRKNESDKDVAFAYLYRCYMCRRFIDHPLSDALGLPKPSWSLKSLSAHFSTFAFLMTLRVYTLLTMKSTWFRNKAYSRHLKAIKTFDAVWSKNNSKRMQSPSQTNKSSAPSCTFALLFSPKAHDSISMKEE
jgi:hypothetical protein